MFAQSYDPLGYEHRQLSSSPDERRRRKERSRRRRIIEADRHRREMLERMLLAAGEFSRHALQIFTPDEESPGSSSPRSGRISSVESGDLLLLDAIFPPPFIYARSVSASLDEMDRDIENHPTSSWTIDQESRGGVVDVEPEVKSQRARSGVKETEPPRMDIDDDCDDDDPSAPPHIIAKEVTSDDEDYEDADDLYSLWRPR